MNTKCYTTDGQTLVRLFGYLGLDAAVSFLFFRSLAAFLIFLPGYYWYRQYLQKQDQNRRKGQMRKEFLDSLQYASTALAAGYSMENAMLEALGQVSKIYPRSSFIVTGLSVIVRGIHLNEPLEKLLTVFARQSEVEEIMEFAEIYSIARICGGDLNAVCRSTIAALQQREDSRQEIETLLAGKAAEQKLMSVIPLMILAYVSLTSPGFMDPMYQGVEGVLIMSGCLLMYLIAFLWGAHIMRIMQ